MNMAAAGFGGQTLNDRLNAARYALAGQGLAQKVCKATTEELMGPKKKHLDCEFVPFPRNDPVIKCTSYKMHEL